MNKVVACIRGNFPKFDAKLIQSKKDYQNLNSGDNILFVYNTRWHSAVVIEPITTPIKTRGFKMQFTSKYYSDDDWFTCDSQSAGMYLVSENILLGEVPSNIVAKKLRELTHSKPAKELCDYLVQELPIVVENYRPRKIK